MTDDDELLTPLQIRMWAARTWAAMSPNDKRLVAHALSVLLDERRAA